MIAFTEDQATALVTDSGTLQRGRGLASPAKWAGLGCTATAAWGECAGSGSEPYLTGIDLTEPAFTCSCPSRAFPCKHGAGLLLLLARLPALLPVSPPPAWLAEWLDKRQVKGEEQARKAAVKTAKKALVAAGAGDAMAALTSAPSAAQQKREAQRHARMQAGAEDLETWLLDLLRAGLADLEKRGASFWETQAARLVDNQLPGLATVLRELADYPTAGPHWVPRLLGRLGELYVLVRAFLNRDNLVPAARQEVWQQVGITPKKDDLLADPAAVIIADTWLVLGQHMWPEERVLGRRSWLWGQHSGRLALVLEFAFGGQPFATALMPQSRYGGELVFYPGLLPLRAAPVRLAFKDSAPEAIPPGQRISQLLESYADALARQPWLRQWPATLTQVLPTPLPGGDWLLHHATEPLTLPLHPAAENAALWPLLAQSGGQPVTVFGEWDGHACRLLGSWPSSPQPAEYGAILPSPLPVVYGVAAPQGAEPLADAPTVALRPTAVPAWPQLVRLALLGTRQSSETLPAFSPLPPTPLREQQLLLLAGTLAVMQKAGFVAPAAATVPPAPPLAPPETQAMLGPLGAECLRELLTTGRYRLFYETFLTQLYQRRLVVPPALVVPLLHYANSHIFIPIVTDALVGERGRWLGQQNPDWQWLVGLHHSQDPTTWETGPLQHRRDFISHLHQTHPEQARLLLAATLPTEPPAHQAALFSTLAHSVSPADEPLLLPYLASKSQAVRQAVVPLLAPMPGSALVERLWQRAASLLAVQRPAAGAAELSITLPPGWDTSWLADGIEQPSSSGERATLLGRLLALLPPSRWLPQLGVATADELLTLAMATEWGRQLLPAWAEAAYLHHDKAFATVLLLRHFAQSSLLRHDHWLPLTWVLTSAEKIVLLRSQLSAGGELPAALPEMLLYVSGPWPADMVAMALRYVATELAPILTPRSKASDSVHGLLRQLALYAPVHQAREYIEALQPTALAYPLLTHFIDELADQLHFRQRLEASWLEAG